MEKPEFSIIVPVFNVEKYISECLHSILNQTFKDFELLIVDDGSTDDSLRMCESITKGTANTRIVSKKNEGLLLTRRFALNQAKGKWIVFIDSDDYVESDLLETLHNYAQYQSRPDLIIYAKKIVSDSGYFIRDDYSSFSDKQVFNGNDGKREIFFEMAKGTHINSMWLKAAKREIYDLSNDYKKYGKIKGEDVVQSLNLINNASSIIYCRKTLYSYRESMTGLGRNLRAKYIQDYQTVYGCFFSLINQKYPHDSMLCNTLTRQYSNYLISLMRALPNYITPVEYRQCSSQIKADNHINITSLAMSGQIQYFLETNMPNLFYYFVRAYNKVKKVRLFKLRII